VPSTLRRLVWGAHALRGDSVWRGGMVEGAAKARLSGWQAGRQGGGLAACGLHLRQQRPRGALKVGFACGVQGAIPAGHHLQVENRGRARRNQQEGGARLVGAASGSPRRRLSLPTHVCRTPRLCHPDGLSILLLASFLASTSCSCLLLLLLAAWACLARTAPSFGASCCLTCMRDMRHRAPAAHDLIAASRAHSRLAPRAALRLACTTLERLCFFSCAFA
jgi:hypothetical protein